MSKRLFVGGLPYSVNDAQLQEFFSKVGAVISSKVIVDKYSGRSKGFGFVEMENDADADKAIETLNNSDFSGRKITVNVARPMEQRQPAPGQNQRFEKPAEVAPKEEPKPSEKA